MHVTHQLTSKEQTLFSSGFQMLKNRSMMQLLDKLAAKKGVPDLKSTVYTIADEIYTLRKAVSHTYRAESKYVPTEVLNDKERLAKFVKETQIQQLYNDSAIKDLAFPLRFCVHPYYVYSYRSVCTKAYWSYDRDTLNICNQSYCTTCCDMAKDVLVSMFDKSPYFSARIAETKFTKYDIAEYYANAENVGLCKQKCKAEYNFDRLFKSSSLSIPSLGKSKLNPALSCVDVKIYGASTAQSGAYYVTYRNSPTSVYCDMARGGWLKVFNYKSSNEITIADSTAFPSNANVNQYVKLANFDLNRDKIKAVRFYCTINSAPFEGIHFETENDAIKDLVIHTFIKQAEEGGNELGLRTDLPFPAELLDLKPAVKASDDLKLQTEHGVELVGKKLFTLENNKNVGWGVAFKEEFEGKLEKVSMCGQISRQKRDGLWVEYETTHEIYVLMHEPNKNYAFERYFKYITKNKK